MSYYYMFSQGEYSDYCVGGLYKSEEELDETYFINYLKSLIIPQLDPDWPEAIEMIKDWPVENICTLTNGYTITTKLFTLVAGDRPKWDNREGKKLWDEAYYGWVKDHKLELDYVNKLVETGVLVKIEYEEIWEG